VFGVFLLRQNVKARLTVSIRSSLTAVQEILLFTARVVSKSMLIWNLGGRGHRMSFGKIFILCHCFLSRLNTPFSRHLIQTQYTADGNHHSNKYAKNTDPDDISLYDGRAYYPNDAEYREYIKNLPKNAPEVSFRFVVSFHHTDKISKHTESPV